MRVIVADDEPLIRAFYERVVELLGHDVIGIAENGIDLVEMSNSVHPDLVITDLQMPVMGGFDAMRGIVGNTKFIVASASDPITLESDLSCRVVAQLVKPFGLSQLQRAIEDAVEPTAQKD